MYGEKIAAIRLSRGFTQQYVATQIGIAQNTYSNVEKNRNIKVNDELLEKIAKALGVTMEDIKSPSPIIMNFHNSPQSGQYNQNSTIDSKIFDELLSQLKLKDEQISQNNKIIMELIQKLS